MNLLRLFVYRPTPPRPTRDCGGDCGCSHCRSRRPFEIVLHGRDAGWKESEHPRGQPGNAGQFGPGGGAAAKTSKAEAPAGKNAILSGDEPVFQSKKEHAQHLLERGVTTKEMLAALGWPSISMPAMAKSLGMKLEKVKEGRQTVYKGVPMTAQERAVAKLPPPGVKRSGGPRSRPKETWSLLEFLVDAGGIDPKDPLANDVRSAIGAKNKFIPGFGNLIRPKGAKLDKLREKAVEAGYMYDPGFGGKGQQTTTVRSLIDTMDRELRGEKVYRGEHTPEHAKAAKEAAAAEESRHRAEQALDDAMRDVDMDPGSITGKQRDRVLQIMEKEGITDPLEAIEREAMEWVTDAAATGKAERILDDIPGWDVPVKPGPASHASGAAAPF